MRGLLLLLTLGACNYPPPDELKDEFTTCDTDSDCVVVELGCCDACNGGEARAVNVASADTVQRRFSEFCGLGYSCTLMACTPLNATCEDGTCTLGQDTGWY